MIMQGLCIYIYIYIYSSYTSCQVYIYIYIYKNFISYFIKKTPLDIHSIMRLFTSFKYVIQRGNQALVLTKIVKYYFALFGNKEIKHFLIFSSNRFICLLAELPAYIGFGDHDRLIEFNDLSTRLGLSYAMLWSLWIMFFKYFYLGGFFMHTVSSNTKFFFILQNWSLIIRCSLVSHLGTSIWVEAWVSSLWRGHSQHILSPTDSLNGCYDSKKIVKRFLYI